MPRNKPSEVKRKLQAVPTVRDQGILGQGGKCNSLRTDGSGLRCKRRAGSGTDHLGYGACDWHGGNSPSLKRHAAKVQARELAAEMEMDPFEALSLCVRLAAGACAFYRAKISELEELIEADEWTATERATGALELSIWVEAYNDERDRLAKHSKLAIDAGIDARRLQIEEEKATMFADALRLILGELKLTPEQRKLAPTIVRKHLLAIDAKVVA